MSEKLHQISSKLSASAPETFNLRSLKLEQVKELGYIKTERARGCVAVLVADEQQRAPIAYEVQGKDDAIHVKGSDERVLRTRYAQLDADGMLPELGKPLGRLGVRQALQQGVLDFRKLGGPGIDPLTRALGALGKPEFALGEVVPLSDCVQGAGGVWNCKLMVQYRDPFMTMIGKKGRLLLEGEFSFVRTAKVGARRTTSRGSSRWPWWKASRRLCRGSHASRHGSDRECVGRRLNMRHGRNVSHYHRPSASRAVLFGSGRVPTAISLSYFCVCCKIMSLLTSF